MRSTDQMKASGLKFHVDLEMEKLGADLAVFQALELEAYSRPMPDGSPRSAENAHQVAKLLYAEHAVHNGLSGLVGASEQVRDHLLEVADAVGGAIASALEALPERD